MNRPFCNAVLATIQNLMINHVSVCLEIVLLILLLHSFLSLLLDCWIIMCCVLNFPNWIFEQYIQWILLCSSISSYLLCPLIPGRVVGAESFSTPFIESCQKQLSPINPAGSLSETKWALLHVLLWVSFWLVFACKTCPITLS